MKEIEKILVPVDFSDNTEKLIEYAQYVAKNFNASIHFLHVIAPPPVDSMVGMPTMEDYRGEIKKHTEERMAYLVESLNNENARHCSGEVLYGDPVEVIVDTARSRNIDTIVISTHGAQGLERILLGSVTERVLKRAHCPVFVLNPFR